MIEAIIYNRNDAEVCRVWLRASPCVDDVLWLADGQIKALDGVRITKVEHQVDRTWRPALVDPSDPPHRLILHVVLVA